jgi:predicted GIY-YIG superfamily endonuclease
MDNQQPSLEKRKVQRLSHKGVLSNINSYIIWEKPPIHNKIYLYKLVDNNNLAKYIGITNNPKTRLSHHINDKTKSYKTNWINHCISNKIEIKMIVFECFDTLEEALIKEEYYINTLDNLTNIELNPTTPFVKKCFIYDLNINKSIEFNSIISAMLYCKSKGILYNKIIKQKYLFSYENNFDEIINNIATIKILTQNNTIIKAVSYYHASKILNCSIGMINSCLAKIRNNVKGNLVSKINEDFIIYKNRTCIKIICLNDNKIFNSIKEASEYYNVDNSLIVKVCKNKRKKVNGLMFKYYE